MIASHVPIGVVVMLDAKPRVAIRKLIFKRIAEDRCLLCSKSEFKRGLCKTHYSRYRSVLQSIPEIERPSFEARQIRAGKLLGSRQGQKNVINEFRK